MKTIEEFIDQQKLYSREEGLWSDGFRQGFLAARQAAIEWTVNRQSQFDDVIADRDRLRAENETLRGAMRAQDSREADAAKRCGHVHSCDWPDQAADEILGLRAENERLRKALEEVTAWLADPKLGYWTYIENGDFYTDRHLFLDRARQALEGKA